MEIGKIPKNSRREFDTVTPLAISSKAWVIIVICTVVICSKAVRTLRHQDSSTPNNWCRSVRTLRH